jgi:PAS domain S-box-containing protein
MNTPEEPGASPEAGLEQLRQRINHLEEVLTAIGNGGVDAVLIGEPEKGHVYTLESADRPYRVIVESMGEGAATVSDRGVILFVNPQLARFVGVERDSMVGRDIGSYVGEEHLPALASLLEPRDEPTARAELTLARPDGTEVPFLVAATELDIDGAVVRCLVLTDLTMQKSVERKVAEEAAQEVKQRVVREMNDTIVQGLVAAEMSLDLELFDDARQAISRTSEQARRWIGELAVDNEIQPGTAVRHFPSRHDPELP